MHDVSVVKNLRTDFSSKSIDDCISFIEKSQNDSENLNLAIASDEDEYMGTVSLKHIKNRSAEFGIAIRSCAMGKGYAKYAMEKIFDIGFNNKGLEKIYWCVDPMNKRAIRFYEKNGYQHNNSTPLPDLVYYTQKQIVTFFWYHVSRGGRKIM